MATKLKNALWFAGSTAIILAMAYFADIGKIWEALKAAKTLPLVPAFAAGLSVFLVWSYIWYRFFKKMEMGIGMKKSFHLFMSGHFLNSITPLGQFGGEPLMAYIISKNSDVDYEEAFSAVFSADLVNAAPTLTFVIGGGFYLLFFGSVNDFIVQALLIVLTATMLGGFLVYLLWFKSGSIEGFLLNICRSVSGFFGRGEKYVKKLEKSLEKVEKSLSTVGESPGHLLKTGIIAHLGFLLQVLCIYFILISLGYPSEFTPLYFVLTFVSLSNFSPTPGGTGTFEAAMAGLLTFFISIPFHTALIAAIIFRLTTYWPGLLIGYLALNRIEYSR